MAPPSLNVEPSLSTAYESISSYCTRPVCDTFATAFWSAQAARRGKADASYYRIACHVFCLEEPWLNTHRVVAMDVDGVFTATLVWSTGHQSSKSCIICRFCSYHCEFFPQLLKRGAALRTEAICPRQPCWLTEALALDSCNSINCVSVGLHCGFFQNTSIHQNVKFLKIYRTGSFANFPSKQPQVQGNAMQMHLWFDKQWGDVWSGFRRADLSPSQ